MMQNKSGRSTPQQRTAHIVRRSDGDRYRVWFGTEPVGTADILAAAHKLARGTAAVELCECWERGKVYERTKRGAWKAVSQAI